MQSEAIGLSRSASKARPKSDLSRLCTTRSEATMKNITM
jgi:hypothetical protein